MGKLFICEGSNEALMLEELYKSRLIFKDFQHSKEEKRKYEQTKVFRHYEWIKKAEKGEIVKIEGGIKKVREIIRKLIAEQQVRYVDAKEVIILCDNEKGNRTLNLIKSYMQELKKKGISFEFEESPICNSFYYLRMTFGRILVKILIASPNLEEVIEKVLRKNLKEIKEKEERRKVLRNFLKICNLKNFLL